MAHNPHAEAPSPSTQANAADAPKQAGGSLVYILLAILLIVVGWYGYDQFVAKRQTMAADGAIRDLADERNKQSITGPDGKKVSEGRVISDDIQKILGRKPYAVEKQKHYTVETYWWYSMPHRNYITVLYLGHEPRRYNTHYINSTPSPDDLPIDFDLEPAVEGKTATDNQNAAEEARAAEQGADAPGESVNLPEEAGTTDAAPPAESSDGEATDGEAKSANEKDKDSAAAPAESPATP